MKSQFFFCRAPYKKELVILRRSRSWGTQRDPVHCHRELPPPGNRSVCLSQGCPDPPAFDDQPSVSRPPAGKLGTNAFPRPQSRCINVILGKLWHLCGEVPRVTLTQNRILSRFSRALVKTKRCPDNGSSLRELRTTPARVSNHFLRSVAPAARYNRVLERKLSTGVIGPRVHQPN
jgi:hypothetical protein